MSPKYFSRKREKAMKLFNNDNNSIRDYGEYTSLLNEGLVFRNSHISGCGHLKISCLVESDIEIEGDVYIGYTGVIKGNITCTNLTVEGIVNGEFVNVAQGVSIIRGGSISSNITCNGLNIADNSVFNGTCNMATRHETILDQIKGPARNLEVAANENA